MPDILGSFMGGLWGKTAVREDRFRNSTATPWPMAGGASAAFQQPEDVAVIVGPERDVGVAVDGMGGVGERRLRERFRGPAEQHPVRPVRAELFVVVALDQTHFERMIPGGLFDYRAVSVMGVVCGNRGRALRSSWR